MENSRPRFSLFITLLYLLPFSVTVAEFGDKPIIFAIPDSAWLLVPLALIVGAPVSKQTMLMFTAFSYFILLGMVGSVLSGGQLTPLVSASNFYLPTIHILSGFILYRRYGNALLRAAPFALACVVWTIFLSDLAFGSFPRGCDLFGRWGGCLILAEVFGFPNSSSSYLALMSPLLYFKIQTTDKKSHRLFYIATLICLTVIIFLSLSRSSILALLMMFVAYLLSTGSWKLLVAVPAGFAAAIIGFMQLKDTFLLTGIILRVTVASQSGDVSNGRTEIWAETIALVSNRPIFGYMFQYFTDFSEFGTAHQQYLEVLFKSGLVGFSLYFGFWFAITGGWLRTRLTANPKYEALRQYWIKAFVLAIMLNAVFQPITSYSIMANILFCLSGIYFAILRGTQK